MAKTIIVAGYGPGISNAVAERFGAEGFSVALVARNAERLAAGVAALEPKGVRAAAFPTDLADPAAVRALVGKVRAALGPVTVLHWNAYAGDAGDLLTADVAALHRVFDVSVSCLVEAVKEALPDLRSQEGAAVLVTNGGFGLVDRSVDAVAVQLGAMGLSVANAAKHKLVGILSERLKPDGVHVAEVMVMGTVKGTAWDNGSATLEAAAVADKFWQLYRGRSDTRAQIQ
jgi:short-subunit dehydrogenase